MPCYTILPSYTSKIRHLPFLGNKVEFSILFTNISLQIVEL